MPRFVALLFAVSMMTALGAGTAAAAPFEWSAPIPLAPTGNSQFLQDVACPSAAQCSAVDSDRVITFDPATGAANAAGVRPLAPFVNALACPSTGQCTAVTGDGSVVTFDPATGTPNAAGSKPLGLTQPTDVTCPTVTLCVVVGLFGDVARVEPATGTVSAPVRLSPDGFFSVACPSASQCTAVGNRGGP